MLHKLSVDANSMAMSYWQEYEKVYTNIFSFRKRKLPEYHTRDVVLSNSMARPMKLRCGVFNKVFVVNLWRDVLNCSYEWLCFSNSYRYKIRKP